MTRVVTVSNRTPGHGVQSRSGGLVVALSRTTRAHGGLWFGWSGTVRPGGPTAPALREADGVCHATIDLSPDDYAGFYLGYSNAVLWPLCHGFAAGADPQGSHYRSYQHVNSRYASALLPLLRHQDVVWVHDYHLLPLGRWLRAAGADQRIGFFLHVPFPDPSALQALPDGAELVRAMFAYDAIGFQTQGDLDGFVRAARWACGEAHLHPDGVLQTGDQVTRVGVFPIGVDLAAVADEVATSRPARRVIEARELRRRHTLFVAADRLVASKGLAHRLRAYDAYLRQAPPSQRPPLFLQIAAPQVHGTPVDAQLAATVDRMAAQIDSAHAGAAATRLRYLRESVPHAELMGMLRAAHVGLVTPLRDGMNLVAKEFVAAQDPEDPGVLVLSVHAGAARELDSALQVDPLDTVAVAAAMRRAAESSLAERRERHQAMFTALGRHDLRAWHTTFLDRLTQCPSASATRVDEALAC